MTPSSRRDACKRLLIGVTAFVLGLGRSLLANGRSSWRLPPIADDLALQLAPLPWLFAFVAFVAWLPKGLMGLMGLMELNQRRAPAAATASVESDIDA